MFKGDDPIWTLLLHFFSSMCYVEAQQVNSSKYERGDQANFSLRSTVGYLPWQFWKCTGHLCLCAGKIGKLATVTEVNTLLLCNRVYLFIYLDWKNMTDSKTMSLSLPWKK